MISEKSNDGNTVNLLWTGGWDSTFRLLQIIFEENRKVQPYYIVDLSRSSWKVEIETMNGIKSLLAKRYPIEFELIKPAIIFDRDDIQHVPEIDNAWNQIKKRRHIGKQYSWLAMFCKQMDLENIELSIQRHTNSENIAHSLIFNLDKEKKTSDEKIVFSYFSYPLKELSKIDMEKIAAKNQWSHILKKTWFCHHPMPNPFKKRIPCGICNPCRVAVEEGFGHKIPALNRVTGKWLKALYNSSMFKKL